jgi:hypothetical protein
VSEPNPVSNPKAFKPKASHRVAGFLLFPISLLMMALGR